MSEARESLDQIKDFADDILDHNELEPGARLTLKWIKARANRVARVIHVFPTH